MVNLFIKVYVWFEKQKEPDKAYLNPHLRRSKTHSQQNLNRESQDSFVK